MGEHSKANIVALITSRITSTRLPGKAMLDIQGKPMIQRVYERVKQSKSVKDVIIATTLNSKPIINLCKENGYKYYVGEEEDILGRLYYAMIRSAGVEHASFKRNDIGKKISLELGDDAIVVRVWGDAPLVDPKIIDEALEVYFTQDVNYVYTDGFPTGTNVAIISFGSLQKAHRKIKDLDKRLWIHKYFIDNPKEFRVWRYAHTPSFAWLDWSVDEQWDLDFANIVYKNLGENFHWEDVMRLICKSK